MPITESMAERVADLLNTQNRLETRYTAASVLEHGERYITRLNDAEELMGVVEVKKVQWYQCEIDHLSVDPRFARQDVGSWLVLAAEGKARENRARIVQCTIRVGNNASECLFKKHGYRSAITFWNARSKNDVTIYQKALPTRTGTNAPSTMCRAGIIRKYASWTVLSALRSGAPIKSRKDVYPLLKTVNFSAVLDDSAGRISQDEFDEWHETAVKRLCELRRELCTGWAAKIVNIYLKTAVYTGGLGRPGLVEVLHPPIDGGLWSGLRRRFAGNELLCKTHAVERIKDIQTYTIYQTIQTGCRIAAEQLGCIPIEVEQLWEGADAE